jgi:hypothetical protein
LVLGEYKMFNHKISLEEKKEDMYEIWWRYRPTSEKGTSHVLYTREVAETVMKTLSRDKAYEYWMEKK